MRSKRMTSLGLLSSVALLVFAAGASAAHSAGHRVFLAGPIDNDEHVALLYKPKLAVLDENERVRSVRWSKWNGKFATGTGSAQLLKFRDSDPDHVKPRVVAQFPVRITLSHPLSGSCERPVWGRAKLKRLDGGPRRGRTSFDLTPSPVGEC